MSVVWAIARLLYLYALRFVALFIAPLLIVVYVLIKAVKAPEDLTVAWQVVQDQLPSVAILVGGVWVFYVFVLGRSFRTSVRIELNPKQTVRRVSDGRIVSDECVLISVKLKNLGQTHVITRECLIGIEPIDNDELLDQRVLNPIINTMDADADWRPIFSSQVGLGRSSKVLEGLEPEQETEANVLLPMGKAPVVKVAVIFRGLVGPTFLPNGWRRLEREKLRKRLIDTIDGWREKRAKTWVSPIFVDTKSHIMDIEVVK